MTSSNRHVRNLLLATVIATAALLANVATASAGVISFSGAERPLAQEWANYSCQDSSRVQEVGSPVAQGQKAYQLEYQPGDNSFGARCEIGMGNPAKSGFPLFQEGDERWISFQVYLPDDYPIDTPLWNLFFQIHQQGDGGCPPIAMGVVNGQFKLWNSARNTYVLDTRQMWSAPATRNRWVTFTVHVLNSTDDNVGFVELYGDLDGNGEQLLLPLTHTHTMTKYSDGGAMINHARVGIYRNPNIPGVAHILFDGFTIATDRESAETAAFGATGPAAPPVLQPPATQPPAQPGSGTSTTPTTSTTPPAPTTNTGSTDTPPTTKTRNRRARVVLRTKHRRARRLARASGHWPSVLPVYGWVKAHDGRTLAGRTVVIEIRRHHRWTWLTRGWLRADGHFYLAPSLDVAPGHRVKLRAHVSGMGYSRALHARV
jgi:hypothetical protein